MSALRQVTQVLAKAAAGDTLDDMLHTLIDGARTLVDADAVALMPQASSSPSMHVSRAARPDPETFPAGELAHRADHEVAEPHRATAAIQVDGAEWGAMEAHRRQSPGFGEGDLAVLKLLAAHIGALLKASEVARAGQVGNGRDALTNLALRPMLDHAMTTVGDQPVVVAAFDIDGLKPVNDQYGHAAGDRLLVTAADALTRTVGRLPGATVVRMGGDEFAALVPSADTTAVTEACQAAIDEVARLLPGAGMSCGVASRHDLLGPLGSGRPLLRLADATLYRAKKSGLQVPLRACRPGGQPAASSVPPPSRTVPDGVAAQQLAALRSPVDVLCRSVDGAAWWISYVPPGSTTLVAIDRVVRRDRRDEGDALQDIGETLDLSELPWTATALDGGFFWAGLNDAGVDPAEQGFLAELGYTGNLTAGCRDLRGGGWLVEVFTDPLTVPLDRFGPNLLHLLSTTLQGVVPAGTG